MSNFILLHSGARKMLLEVLKKKGAVLSQLFGDDAKETNKAVYISKESQRHSDIPKISPERLDISTLLPERLDIPARPLGELEKYYYDWGNIWDDAFCSFISLTSKQAINIDQLSRAVTMTIQQHPILRTSFNHNGKTVELVTHKTSTANIEMVERNDFQLILKSFSLKNKVWRLVFLKPDSNETTHLSLIFGVHHSFCDFTYKREIIRYILNILFNIEHGECIEVENGTELSEPIENLIENTKNFGSEKHINFLTTNRKEKKIIPATAICKRHFREAYQVHCREDTNKILRWSIDKNLTEAFRASLSKCHGSINSALITVFLSSFMELVQSSIKDTEVVELPFSVMVNLRKYLGKDRVYNGNASIDMLGLIELDSALKSSKNFWSFAHELSKKMREKISSGEPLRYLHEDVKEFDFQAVIDNNKREVIALTHTGHVDDYLGSGGHFNLVDYKINMRTSKDIGPIFNVETHFLQEELYVSLGYNSGFIPDTAAHDLTDIVNKIFKWIT